MPLFSELGWILEIAKLLGRFAPLMDRLLPSPEQLAPEVHPEVQAELRQQAASFRSRLEAYLSDLRKQVQEQNLKLHQIQEEVRIMHGELEASTKLVRDLTQEMRSLRLWLFVTFGISCLGAALLLVVLLRH